MHCHSHKGPCFCSKKLLGLILPVDYFFLLHVRKPKLFRILLLFSPQSLVLAGLLDADVTCTVCSGAAMPPKSWGHPLCWWQCHPGPTGLLYQRTVFQCPSSTSLQFALMLLASPWSSVTYGTCHFVCALLL